MANKKDIMPTLTGEQADSIRRFLDDIKPLRSKGGYNPSPNSWPKATMVDPLKNINEYLDEISKKLDHFEIKIRLLEEALHNIATIMKASDESE